MTMFDDYRYYRLTMVVYFIGSMVTPFFQQLDRVLRLIHQRSSPYWVFDSLDK
jgi:hypothetical protein